MSKIEESVITKIRERAKVGLGKYGVSLERTDLSRKEWLQHAQDEAMDLSGYLEKLMQEESQNPFQNQKGIMQAWGQKTLLGDATEIDWTQAVMYQDLIKEEYSEWLYSDTAIEEVDGLVDMLVVIIGRLYSIGVDAQEAWNRVHASNLSKIDPETGKVIKRESDGKVLKPPGYFKPELSDLVEHLD